IGQWSAAAKAAEAALIISNASRASVFLEPSHFASLARAHLGAGHPDQARKVAESAVALARERGVRLFEIVALLAHSRALLAIDGAPVRALVETDLRDADALIDATGARAYAPWVNVERAELARVLGDEATRERELREAHRLFLEIGAPIARHRGRALGS